MNCQEFWDRMPELSEPQPQQEEAGHLAACAECAGAWQRHRAVEAGMRRLSVEWKHVQAPAGVEARLVAAFQSQTLRRHTLRPRSVWAPIFSGIAAALLVAVGLFLVRDRPPQLPRHTAPGTVELAALSSSPEAAVDDQAPDSDGFIPLPNAERIGPDENVNVVRVEVPRSAMLAVGYPVSADRSSELVEADVKMGSNGLALAVRFVDE